MVEKGWLEKIEDIVEFFEWSVVLEVVWEGLEVAVEEERYDYWKSS